ncbi:hypothetical protein [Jiulongibacter sp. NS-SX5]|uniref:hypothetical protein n=1 Tax=Jiulongibacter sp. NS-SX5 TaxID=3463854 RepID=UPI004058D27C
MRLDNHQLHDLLIEKDIQVLYHANTLTTSITYFQQNGLLSRGAVEILGLNQTTQTSDEADKLLNVWNDVFLDSTDLHTFFGRQNYYGPILFELDISLVLNQHFEIWVTKNNPIYWNRNTLDSNRYFQNIDELRSDWDLYPRQKKMITIRNNSTPILFEHVRRVIVDDPRVVINEQDGTQTHLFNEAVKLINANISNGHSLQGKFIVRECGNCWCRDNYLKQVPSIDLKRLFL